MGSTSPMFLYLISPPRDFVDWEKYDSAVVVADSAEQAKTMHPNGVNIIPLKSGEQADGWVDDPSQVTATYLGQAVDGYTKPVVILASFNPG